MEFEDYSKRPVDRSPEALLMFIEAKVRDNRESMNWVGDKKGAMHYQFRKATEQFEAVAMIIRQHMMEEERMEKLMAESLKPVPPVVRPPRKPTIMDRVNAFLRKLGVIK